MHPEFDDEIRETEYMITWQGMPFFWWGFIAGVIWTYQQHFQDTSTAAADTSKCHEGWWTATWVGDIAHGKQAKQTSCRASLQIERESESKREGKSESAQESKSQRARVHKRREQERVRERARFYSWHQSLRSWCLEFTQTPEMSQHTPTCLPSFWQFKIYLREYPLCTSKLPDRFNGQLPQHENSMVQPWDLWPPGCTKHVLSCCRLVVADVSFYIQNLKSLSGLSHISDNMDSIWDQRW